MSSERDSKPRFNRAARAKPGQPIVSGKAPTKPGEYEVLTALTVVGGDPPPPPPTGRPAYEDAFWGGPIGSGGQKVVEGSKAEWKGRNPTFANNTDYVNPKVWGLRDDTGYCIGQSMPTGVRLFNPTFEDIRSEDGHALYFNMGRNEDLVKFVIFGGHSRRIQVKRTWGEFKMSAVLVENHEVDDDCRYGQFIRQRFGQRLVAIGGRSHGVIAARGWCHWVDVPGAIGLSWSGPLPYRHAGGPGGGWGKLHDSGQSDWAGHAWQGSEGCYFGPTLSSVQLGVPSGGQPSKYPSLDCFVHPSLGDRVKELGPHKGTRSEAIEHYRELWARYDLGED